MSKRLLVLMLALAAVLLATALLTTGCAPRTATRTERRLDALDRYSFLEFRLRFIHYELALIEDEITADKDQGADTTLEDIDPEGVADQMDELCPELVEIIAAIEAEIARLQQELANAKGDAKATADGATALARVAGLVDILQSIEIEVEAVKVPGGASMQSCDAARIELQRLQEALTKLAEQVKTLQAGIANAASTGGP